MFCQKCGAQIADGSSFCEKCGNKVGITNDSPKKVMLDPREVVEHKTQKDSSKTFAGNGKAFGIILMLVSVIGNLVALVAIGTESFIPATIIATVVFVIGFLLTMFSPS